MATTRKYDLYSDDFRRDTYETFGRMRAEDPILCQPGIDGETMLWFITRHDDVVAVLLDDETFVRDPALALDPDALAAWSTGLPESFAFIDQHMLNRDGDDHHFMDNDTYDQFILTTDQLGETAQYLKDGMTLDRTSYQGETIGVELPVTVDLLVADTEPGFAGDTQTGARKPATTETGLVVTVPIFIESGDTIRVDTRTGEYQTRV